MVAVHAAQELAHARLEVRVAARAPPPPSGAEVRHRRLTEAAANSFGARRRGRELLLQELAERMIRLGRFDAALRGALLAQMELAHGVVLDLREVHRGVALAAVVAHHGTTSRTSV